MELREFLDMVEDLKEIGIPLTDNDEEFLKNSQRF